MKLSELFDAYMRHHVRKHCRTGDNLERMFKSYLSPWADRDVTTITRMEVLDLHTWLGENVGTTTANRVVQLLRPMYNRGLDFGIISCPNPAKNIKPYRERSRSRFIEHDELQRFFAAVDTLRYPVTRDFMLMCLFTGARRSNVASMRWDELNLDREVWTVPEEKSKNFEQQNIPLLPPAQAALVRRLEQRRGNCPWVFPSMRSPKGHLTRPEKAWKAILERADLTDTRIHDLRRTLGAYMAMTGASLLVVGETLHHKDPKSTKIYTPLTQRTIRDAMNKAIDAML